MCLWARRRLALSARHVVVPSAGRAEHLRKTLGRQDVHVVFNCPPRSEVRNERSSTASPLRLGYHGTVVPQRLPLAIAEAVARTNGAVILKIAGYEPAGAEGYARSLVTRAVHLGAPGAIVYAGVLSPDAMKEFSSSFDVGLALVPTRGGDVNMATMAGASNKAFEYLAHGLPLIVSDVEDWRKMFVEPGYAIAVVPDDTASLLAAFLWLRDNRDAAKAMGAAGQRRVRDEWNYESQFGPLCHSMFALGHPSTRLAA
jgi:glycosyltransferase involved in cell wall biosynthesis